MEISNYEGNLIFDSNLSNYIISFLLDKIQLQI